MLLGVLFPSSAVSGELGVEINFQGGWIISRPCCPLRGEGGVLCSALPGFTQKDRAEQVGRRTTYYLMFFSKHFVFACIQKLSIKYVHTSVHNLKNLGLENLETQNLEWFCSMEIGSRGNIKHSFLSIFCKCFEGGWQAFGSVIKRPHKCIYL